MEFLQIMDAEDFRAKEIFTSYCITFPEDERRDETQFRALFKNPKVKIFTVLEELNNIGYIISWELTNFVFIEHFEIFSEFRSQKFGSEIIGHLFKNYLHIVLEAEPEDLDDEATKRIEFYRKNGFITINKNYMQPAYNTEKNPVNLWLLANWNPENTDWILEEIYDVVYC